MYLFPIIEINNRSKNKIFGRFVYFDYIKSLIVTIQELCGKCITDYIMFYRKNSKYQYRCDA